MEDIPVFRITLLSDPCSSDSEMKLNIHDVYDLVNDQMEISYSDIFGVQKRGPKAYEIMIKSEVYEMYEDTIDVYMHRHTSLSNGKVVTVNDAYEQITDVLVRGFPMYWEEDKIRRIIGYYGEIKHMTKEKYREIDAEGTCYEGLWNGNRRFKMKLKTRIPCGLTVCNERLEFFIQNKNNFAENVT